MTAIWGRDVQIILSLGVSGRANEGFRGPAKGPGARPSLEEPTPPRAAPRHPRSAGLRRYQVPADFIAQAEG